MDSKQRLIDYLTEQISDLETYKDSLENHPGQVISERVTHIIDLLKTNVSQGMSDHLNERKDFFNGGGAQDWITSELERINPQINLLSTKLSELQE